MENVNRKDLISVLEIIAILIIFSFVLYSLYPKDKLFEYVINEDKNTELTEAYLKNIVSKYPQEQRFLFSLIDIYIRQNRIAEAEKLIYSKEKHIKDKDNILKIYKNRIKLKLIKDKEEKEYLQLKEFLKEFYSSDIIWESKEKEKYIKEFIDKMISINDYQTPKEVFDKIIIENNNFENKRLALINYINIIKSQKNFSDEAKKIRKYENYFIKDIDLSNTILKTYLQASKPDMAREFAIKILKTQKII